MSTALIRAGVQAGQRWAMEVPDTRVYHWTTGSPMAVPAARAATMSTPGAVMSGFMA
jgi:hypothetical protein